MLKRSRKKKRLKKKTFADGTLAKSAPTDSKIVSLRLHWVVAATTLILPFFILYWMVPFIGKHTIGNDYLSYWIRMQMYLRFSIENGTFPLYAPGFNGGWTSSALTLGQMYHPIFWLAAVIPGYWNGQAHVIGTFLRLVSLGGTHLVLFLFLRRVRLGISLAFVLSLITVYNLRMLDMFRYGASLGNYVGHLLLCAAVAWHYVRPTKRIGPLCIAICTWLLVVGGHPQIMYFGLLGAAFVCLVTPFYAARLLPHEVQVTRRRLRTYYLSVAISVGIGVILGSSYTLPFYFEYLSESSRGVGVTFDWACGHQNAPVEALHNFFNPFHSMVTGSFGGSALILMVALMPLLLVCVRVPLVILSIWLICAVTFVLSLGSNGPLYYYFWKYFPFAQSFRVPGRLNMVLPFMFMLILAWMSQLEHVRVKARTRELRFRPVALVAAGALILFIVLRSVGLEALTSQERWLPVKMHSIPSIASMLALTTGLVSFAALILCSNLRRFKWITGLFFAAAVLLQVTTVLRYGTWVAPGPIRTPTLGQMRAVQQKRLAFHGPSGDWTRTLIEEHLQQTFLEPVLARICPKYTVVASREKAYEHMARERAADHVFVENYPGTEVSSGPSPSAGTGIDKVILKYNSFNNLKFDVTCVKPAFFVFSYPYSKHWQAYVDGKQAPVFRANGLEHTVWLQAGRSEVELRYSSWPAMVGASLTILAIVSIAIGGAVRLRIGALRWVVIIAVPCVCVLVFLIWYRSLYHGGSIGTHYTWTSEAIKPNLSSRSNLAYGKVTSTRTKIADYSQASPLGVDGDRSSASGFITNVEEHAWWQVDLGQTESIGQIVLYKLNRRIASCSLPLDITVSRDGKQWSPVQRIAIEDGQDRWRVRLKGVAARYIRLQTQRRGRLALAEVEVYGPHNAELGG